MVMVPMSALMAAPLMLLSLVTLSNLMSPLLPWLFLNPQKLDLACTSEAKSPRKSKAGI